jgi:hypothetical protein
MQITSLDQMETIVSANKSLSWDGWTVVQRSYDPTAWSKANGVFKNSQWHVESRYAAEDSGWNIPQKFVR